MFNLRILNLLVSSVLVYAFLTVFFLLSLQNVNAAMSTARVLPLIGGIFRYASRAMRAEARRAKYVFSRWNKPISVYSPRRRSYSPVLRLSSRFQVSARFSARPNVHPRGELVHELSFFVHKQHVTQEYSDALVHCVDEAHEKEWELYNAEQFSDDTAQIEYFVSIPSRMAHEWRRRIHEFLAAGKHHSCIGNDEVIYARQVQIAHDLPKNFIGEESWILKVIAVFFCLIAMEISVLLRLRKMRKSATDIKISRTSHRFSNVYTLRSTIS